MKLNRTVPFKGPFKGLKKIIAELIIIIICLCGCTQSPDSPEGRDLEFTRNQYSGKAMRAEDWLTREARTSRLFTTFGGIDALVKDSASESQRNQGVQSIKIKSVKKQGGIVFIETEVVFNNKEVSSSLNPWIIEDGKWKMTVLKKEE